MNLFSDEIFNLAEVVRKIAKEDPQRIAVIEPKGRQLNGKRRYKKYTYARISADAESVAPGLREMGVAEGTRTVFMAPPGYESCVMQLALTRVGATTVWIDPAVGYLNVAERLRRIEPEAFVGLPIVHAGRLLFGWGSRLLRKTIVVGEPGFPGARSVKSLRRKAPAEPKAPAVSPDDPALVLYTTGSTGPAKPTLYLHRNFCEVLRIVRRSWRADEMEGIPVDMPAFPAFSFVGLSMGGTVVVPPINFALESPAKADPRAMLEVINDCGVKSMFASPVLLENLGRYAAAHGIKTPSFKRVIGGGAPITAAIMGPLMEMMGEGGEVASNYGATEALPSTEMEASEYLRETAPLTLKGVGICVGRPFPGIEIKIARMSDEPIPSMDNVEELPAGEIGEILLRGKHVSPAYFWDEESTRKNKIPDGEGSVWHRVGDAGYLDKKGRLWYCGRVSQRVKASGGDLFSLQCEPIFDAHPKVRRSGLVGVRRGAAEVPVICIEVEQGVRQSELAGLRAELLELAAKHAVTKSISNILFHPGLPVDPRHNSKIERPKLAQWAAKRLAGRLKEEATRPAQRGPLAMKSL